MKNIYDECLPPLSPEEEVALFERYKKNGDQAAREKLCRANFALVIKLARKFACPELDMEELISQGLYKLIICIENFDLARGYRFSTYFMRALVFGYLRARSDERRHQFGRLQIDDDEGLPLEEIAIADTADALLTDLETILDQADLPPLELAAIRLTFMGAGLAPAEVALELGVTSRQVIHLIEDGIEKLRGFANGC